MATTTHAMQGASTPASARDWSHAAATGVGAYARQLWSAYWRHRAQRGTVVLLHSLSDRCLGDIGIDRSEIESVVYSLSDDRLRRYRHD
jgi:uncharacterized protein YjiS (DUF1127 family)